MVRRLSNAKIITDGRIIEGSDILYSADPERAGTILDVIPAGQASSDDVYVTDLDGAYVAPGFIDIHCHGGDGFEFIDATEEAILRALELHKNGGTRVLYPTLSAASFETYDRVLTCFANITGKLPLEVPGFHLEGPYLSPQYCGAQNASYIHEPREEEYVPFFEKHGALIKRWSYAPETDPERTFLRFLLEHDVVPAIAHSAAEYAEILPAYEAGLRLVTHLYSCTSTIVRRQGFRHIGVIESAYLLDGMYTEAIADNRHLPPELLRLIVKLKGEERVALITDAIRPAGLSDGEAGESGGVGYIVEDGVAKLTDRSAFAGSVATTGTLLRCAAEAGIPLEKTVRMLTETPAAIMRLPGKGRIAKGYDADFTMIREDLTVAGPENLIPNEPECGNSRKGER